MTGVWYCWTNSATSTTSASTDNTWQIWCDGTTSSSSSVTYQASAGTVWVAWAETHELTTEEKEQQRIRQEQQRAEEEKLRLEKEQANQKAEQLLKNCLTPKQRKQLDEMSAFIVKNGMKTYKIKRGWAGNVEELDKNGNIVARLCAHPIERVPDADNMLTQKIMLEHAEQDFLRIANRTPIYQ